jgi:molybdenum cofactor cytidylyltransferase
MASPRVGVILLAAGNSTRMGRPKQLLSHRGSTLLRHAAAVALETGFTPVVVVLGAEAEACRAALAGLPIQPVVNHAWREGMGTSLRTGIAELIRLAPQLDAVLILLHDQPRVTARRLRELVAACTPAACAVASAYDETLGVPALFARELFADLVALSEDQGARRLLQAHRERVIPFDFPEAAHDIDTPDDYERLSQGV